jgi:3-oxoacyl-[acyl-carrier protein] reductase
MFGNIIKDKVAVVTGGAIGMGEASVRLFVREGGKAVIVDTNAERGQALAAELPKGSAIFVKTDVSNEDSVAQAVKTAVDKFSRIDILVNCAGITSLWGPVLIEDVKLEDWNRMMSINLTGTFLVIKHTMPHMKSQKYGRIVNISSTAAIGTGYKGGGPYAASKAGMLGLTKMVAKEGGSYGITCNAIGPGPVKTPTRQILVDNQDKLLPTVPVGFFAEAEDLANVIMYLASDAARFITGQFLLADGGISLPWDIDAILAPSFRKAG